MTTPFDRRSVPKLAPGIDLTTLPLGAREGFILSRVDGRLTLMELANVTAFPVDELERMFTRLVELRAAYFGDTPPTPPPQPTPPLPPPEPADEKASATTPTRKRRPRRWGESDLAAEGDLAEELKIRILDLFHDLEDLDHYELLVVARDADRKAIKNAYYALASTFHTDRYFGKKLGAFKTKMEQIFGRITQAHDTLANKAKRAEYDAYLVDLDRTRAFERYLAEEEEEPPRPSKPPESRPKPIAAPPPTTDTLKAVTALLPPIQEAPAPASSSNPPDPGRLRREALAKRLAGASSGRVRAASPISTPPPRAATIPPTTPTPEQAQAATDALRRRYEEGRDHARKIQARRLIDAAEASLAKNDLLAGANNLRLAMRWTDDPEIARKYEDVNRRARDVMADTYLKQAKYEEQSGKWGAAALSYIKAHEGRPEDGEICDRVAHAFRMDGRDLHKAARFGELAVQKNPNHAPFRVTLGSVYLDAGLFLRARSELEQAAKLDPSNAQIKELLARARKMSA
ncbi:MAG: DnaJ domain-containing protein [Polyangiales bacterium]